MKKRTIIFSLGGSLIAPSQNIDTAFLKRFKKMLLEYLQKNKDAHAVIICGGGRVNSHYNEAAQKIGNPKAVELDWLGIKVTHVNAELVRIMFGNMAHKEVVTGPEKLVKTNKRIIVGGGWVPGASTDKVAVSIAEKLGAKEVINMSNIDYVYTADPRKNKNAKKLVDISWKELRAIVGNKWSPRINSPFDPIASRDAQKLGMKVVVLNGKKLANIKNFLDGKSYKGTTVNS